MLAPVFFRRPSVLGQGFHTCVLVRRKIQLVGIGTVVSSSGHNIYRGDLSFANTGWSPA